jgi:hypothetical protein
MSSLLVVGAGAEETVAAEVLVAFLTRLGCFFPQVLTQ